jgi:hypothetical protein
MGRLQDPQDQVPGDPRGRRAQRAVHSPKWGSKRGPETGPKQGPNGALMGTYPGHPKYP